jgi:hypothetical protein
MRILAFAALVVMSAAPLRPADTDSMDSVVRAVYDVISGPQGPRDWVRFKALFADGARLISVRVSNGIATPNVMTPDEFAERSGANAAKSAFYEAPVAQRVETFGNIAHVFSTYESRRAPGDKPFARGINSFQLVHAGGSWKVMTILWDSERDGQPIPEKYLK